MKLFFRRAFNGAAVGSLLLFVTTAALWVRGYRMGHFAWVYHMSVDGDIGHFYSLFIESGRGTLGLEAGYGTGGGAHGHAPRVVRHQDFPPSSRPVAAGRLPILRLRSARDAQPVPRVRKDSVCAKAGQADMAAGNTP